jgi:hypothetical protein
MLIRKTTLLAKVETTYGTDATPTPEANAILCKNPDPRATGEELVRDNVRSTLGPLAHVIGEKYGEVKFSTELKGSGSAGVAPEIGPLFRACAFKETVVESTSVAYDPDSGGDDSLTIYVYRDGLLYKLTGCRGTAEVDLSAGKYGEIAWTFQGIWNDPVDAALVDGTYAAVQPPVVFSAALSIGGYAAVCTKLALNLANSLAQRRDMNHANAIREIAITGWNDRGGSFDPEAALEAAHPFYANWKNGVQAALTCTVGGTAGNRCVVSAPKAQYKSIGPGERDGIYVYDIPLRLAVNAGDDEVKFLFN